MKYLLIALLLTACGSQTANQAALIPCPSGLYGANHDGQVYDSGTMIIGDLTFSGGNKQCTYSGTYSCDESAGKISTDIKELESGTNCLAPGGPAIWSYRYTASALILSNEIATLSFEKR